MRHLRRLRWRKTEQDRDADRDVEERQQGVGIRVHGAGSQQKPEEEWAQERAEAEEEMERVDEGPSLRAVGPLDERVRAGPDHAAGDPLDHEERQQEHIPSDMRDEEEQRPRDDLGASQCPAAQERAQRDAAGAQEEDHADLAQGAARLPGQICQGGPDHRHVQPPAHEQGEVPNRLPKREGHSILRTGASNGNGWPPLPETPQRRLRRHSGIVGTARLAQAGLQPALQSTRPGFAALGIPVL